MAKRLNLVAPVVKFQKQKHQSNIAKDNNVKHSRIKKCVDLQNRNLPEAKDDLEPCESDLEICAVCFKTFSHHKFLKEHMKSSHASVVGCIICYKEFDTVVSLVKHVKSHPNYCDKCQTKFISQKQLLLHFKKVHRNIQKKCRTCLDCQTKFFSKAEYAEHCSLKHDKLVGSNVKSKNNSRPFAISKTENDKNMCRNKGVFEKIRMKNFVGKVDETNNGFKKLPGKVSARQASSPENEVVDNLFQPDFIVSMSDSPSLIIRSKKKSSPVESKNKQNQLEGPNGVLSSPVTTKEATKPSPHNSFQTKVDSKTDFSPEKKSGKVLSSKNETVHHVSSPILSTEDLKPNQPVKEKKEVFDLKPNSLVSMRKSVRLAKITKKSGTNDPSPPSNLQLPPLPPESIPSKTAEHLDVQCATNLKADGIENGDKKGKENNTQDLSKENSKLSVKTEKDYHKVIRKVTVEERKPVKTTENETLKVEDPSEEDNAYLKPNEDCNNAETSNSEIRRRNDDFENGTAEIRSCEIQMSEDGITEDNVEITSKKIQVSKNTNQIANKEETVFEKDCVTKIEESSYEGYLNSEGNICKENDEENICKENGEENLCKENDEENLCKENDGENENEGNDENKDMNSGSSDDKKITDESGEDIVKVLKRRVSMELSRKLLSLGLTKDSLNSEVSQSCSLILPCNGVASNLDPINNDAVIFEQPVQKVGANKKRNLKKTKSLLKTSETNDSSKTTKENTVTKLPLKKAKLDKIVKQNHSGPKITAVGKPSNVSKKRPNPELNKALNVKGLKKSKLSEKTDKGNDIVLSNPNGLVSVDNILPLALSSSQSGCNIKNDAKRKKTKIKNSDKPVHVSCKISESSHENGIDEINASNDFSLKNSESTSASETSIPLNSKHFEPKVQKKKSISKVERDNEDEGISEDDLIQSLIEEQKQALLLLSPEEAAFRNHSCPCCSRTFSRFRALESHLRFHVIFLKDLQRVSKNNSESLSKVGLESAKKSLQSSEKTNFKSICNNIEVNSSSVSCDNKMYNENNNVDCNSTPFDEANISSNSQINDHIISPNICNISVDCSTDKEIDSSKLSSESVNDSSSSVPSLHISPRKESTNSSFTSPIKKDLPSTLNNVPVAVISQSPLVSNSKEMNDKVSVNSNYSTIVKNQPFVLLSDIGYLLPSIYEQHKNEASIFDESDVNISLHEDRNGEQSENTLSVVDELFAEENAETVCALCQEKFNSKVELMTHISSHI